MQSENSVAILHGAGYAGGQLIRLLLRHPVFQLGAVTSRSFAGKPLWVSHPVLRGQTDLEFVTSDDILPNDYAAIFITAEHGKGAEIVVKLLEGGYTGKIVDLSADFRLKEPAMYNQWYGFDHPAPELLDTFVYGMPEATGVYPEGTRYIANPGCFATGIALALHPVVQHLSAADVSITALTGASGSGASPKPTTHYPTREGNVRAYKVLRHQHLAEVRQLLGSEHHIAFTPVSGPWVRGIWGTARFKMADTPASEIAGWYEAAYGNRPLVRLWPNSLPELRFVVDTPFCDIGWVVEGDDLVVGFAIDNLLKGAASQAVQNLNIICGLPETTGLLPSSTDIQISNGYTTNYKN